MKTMVKDGEVAPRSRFGGAHVVSQWKGIHGGWDSFSKYLWFEIQDGS